MSPRGFLRARADRALIADREWRLLLPYPASSTGWTVQGYGMRRHTDRFHQPSRGHCCSRKSAWCHHLMHSIKPKVPRFRQARQLPCPVTSHELVSQKAAPEQAERVFRFRRVDECYDMRRPSVSSTIRKITGQKTAGMPRKNRLRSMPRTENPSLRKAAAASRAD